MFKKQLLSQEDYREETIINKWFFGSGSLLDKGYDIPDDVYNRMKLTYNVLITAQIYNICKRVNLTET